MKVRMDLIPDYEHVKQADRLFLYASSTSPRERMDLIPGYEMVRQSGRLLREHPAQHQDQEWTSYLAMRR
jgi:hypothetical protein